MIPFAVGFVAGSVATLLFPVVAYYAGEIIDYVRGITKK